jgi:hypothetical protein
MIGSISHYKLGNLKIKLAVIFAVPSIYFFTFIRKIIIPLIPSNLANIGGFDITKDLLIMVVLHS